MFSLYSSLFLHLCNVGDKLFLLEYLDEVEDLEEDNDEETSNELREAAGDGGGQRSVVLILVLCRGWFMEITVNRSPF